MCLRSGDIYVFLTVILFCLFQLIGVFTGFDFLDDEIDEHDDDISGFGWDLPSGEYTTPEPGDSRLRHSPLSGSEPDMIASYRLDTSDEEDEVCSELYLIFQLILTVNCFVCNIMYGGDLTITIFHEPRPIIDN